MPADNIFDFPVPTSGIESNTSLGNYSGIPNLFQTATYAGLDNPQQGLPTGYNFGVNPNQLDPYAELQYRTNAGTNAFSGGSGGVPNLFQTATYSNLGDPTVLPTVEVPIGPGGGNTLDSFLAGGSTGPNIFTGPQQYTGGNVGGIVTMAPMVVSTDTTPTVSITETFGLTPTSTDQIVTLPPVVVTPEPTPPTSGVITMPPVVVTPEPTVQITQTNTGSVVTLSPVVVTPEPTPSQVVTLTPMVVTPGPTLTASISQVTLSTPSISVSLGTPTISIPQTTPATTVSVSVTPPNPFTPAVTVSTPSSTPSVTSGVEGDWWRNYLREGTQTLGDLNQLYPGMLDLYTKASQGYSQADAARLAALSGQGGQFSATQGNLNDLAAQQTLAANSALRAGNLADAQRFAMQAEQLKRQANPELYAGMEQFQGAAGGQVAADLAKLQQAQARQLSPEDIRNAQQAAREAYSARGLAMGPGAIGAEILNRENLARQREQEARQNLAGSMGQLYQGIGARTANVFDPLAATLGQQYGMQTQNVGMTSNLMNQLGQLASGGYGNQYVQNQYNPFNPYAQDVYNSNFNARAAQQLAAANNAAALEAARIQAEAAKSAGNTNALSQVGAAILPHFFETIFCWVAREVYGEDNPKWLMFRHWTLNHAPESFRNWYLNNGEAFAEWLKANAWAKPAIRAFMDSRINSMNQSEIIKSQYSHAL